MKQNRIENAWSIIKYQHNMDAITEGEIMEIIALSEAKVSSYSVLQNIFLFALLLLSCQGG